MRFLVDENLPFEAAALLEREGHDVLHVAATDLRGAADREVWRRAAEQGRIIVTRDLDFPLPEAPEPAGLILLRLPDTFTKDRIVALLSELVSTEVFANVAGSVTVVSPGRVRTRKL